MDRGVNCMVLGKLPILVPRCSGHLLFLLATKHLYLIPDNYLPMGFGGKHRNMSSWKLKNALSSLFLVLLAASVWTCDLSSTNQIHLFWSLTTGPEMEGSKDPDGASLAVEAISMRSSSQSNRPAMPATVPSVWGHLCP